MQDLFGQITPLPISKETTRRKAEVVYKQMTTLYGITEGQKCKSCKHLYFKECSGKYPKCSLSGCTGSSRSSDWNSRWPACGKFEQV